MASIQAQLMNQILSLGPKDDPGKPHDYEAERQSYRNPPPLCHCLIFTGYQPGRSVSLLCHKPGL